MSATNYSLTTRLMHWLLAPLLLFILALGIYMVSTDVDNKQNLYSLHKSLGIIILPLVAIRIVARLSRKAPDYTSISRLMQVLANLTHLVLYLFLIFVPLSGLLMNICGGKAIEVFGATLPRLSYTNPELAGKLHALHILLPYFFIALLILHVAAAILHFIKKDEVCKRISLR